MKNNISYYRHETNSHNHWKFKTLRRKFGWEGEGKFWALNNMIAEAENCWLDLSNHNLLESISADLDMDMDEFEKFLKFLVENARLIKKDDDRITTGIVQETLEDVMKKRSYQKNWVRSKTTLEKDLSNTEDNLSNIESEKSNIEKQVSNIENEQSKVKESKEENRIPITPNGGGDSLQDLIKEFTELDKTSRIVHDFILTKNPSFIEPYIYFWNMFAAKFGKSKVSAVTDARKRKFNTRSKEENFNFLQIIKKASLSNLLIEGKWFTFDWVFESEANYIKVLEGNYDNSTTPVKPINNKPQQPQTTDLDILKQMGLS